MPLFSWRPKLLGRRTPEPAQALHVSLPPEPKEIKKEEKRSVQFGADQERTFDQRQPASEIAGANCVGGPKLQGDQRSEWRYADDIRIGIAPLARQEDDRGRFTPLHQEHSQQQSTNLSAQIRIGPQHNPPVQHQLHQQQFLPQQRAATVLASLRGEGKQPQLDPFEARRRAAANASMQQPHIPPPMMTSPMTSPHVPMTSSQMTTSASSNMSGSINGSVRPLSPEHYGPYRGEIEVRQTDYSDSPSLASRPTANIDELNVVFLQYNDEVKRTMLPTAGLTIDQVRLAFVRCFPQLTRAHVDSPSVKVYIQEPSKGQLFYELDDLRDIKNKSVLKLREQSEYYSENEEEGRHRFVSLARPASAMAAPAEFQPYGYGAYGYGGYRNELTPGYGSGRESATPSRAGEYRPETSSRRDLRSPSVGRMSMRDRADSGDERSEAGSDSRGYRSGSATPIIDHAARVRMETMERQLTSLSSLVHSALVSKGMSESTQRDMHELRKEILALHSGNQSDSRAASEEPPSLPDSITSNTHHQLAGIKERLEQANNDARQLRRTAQTNAHTARQLIQEAGDQINSLIREKVGAGPVVAAVPVVRDPRMDEEEEAERRRHENTLIQLLEKLTEFETSVEELRGSVLSTNRKLRMSEVEGLTESLTQIGRQAATLKTDFPAIQGRIEARIKADMERVVREEKYIRDQTGQVDQSLRRCKALANIMVTMKKLAMVQDPALQRRKESPIPAKEGAPAPPPVPPKAKPAGLPTGQPQPPSASAIKTSIDAPATSSVPNDYQPENPAPPPRPPSRYSVPDVRAKFSQPPELPAQIKSLIEDVSRRAPSPANHDERRQNMEQRAEALAEKQRQLQSQFHIMQHQ